MKAMDVVYVIGRGSKWQNNELRYSLRSICRYGIGLGKVIIVGDELPEFVNEDKVTYLECNDQPGDSPARNVYRKIAHVFARTDLDAFLLSSDDHFFIKPTYFDLYPLYYKGARMPSGSEKGIGDKRYTQTMADTGRYMEELGLDMRFFEGHTNKLYMRVAWSLMSDSIERWMSGTEYGISTNAPMQACILKVFPMFPCQYRKDIKLEHLNTPEDRKQLKDANSFSIYDSAINSGVAEYLAGLFPSPCRFEKTACW